MSDSEDGAQYDFSTAGQAGTSTYPVVASALRKDEYIVIDGQACKIVKIEASQSSISVEGIDIFTDELHKCTLHTNDNVDVPTVASNEYKLVNIDEGFLCFATETADFKEDVMVPGGDLGSQISSDFNEGKNLVVTVHKAMGDEQATSYKEASE